MIKMSEFEKTQERIKALESELEDYKMLCSIQTEMVLEQQRINNNLVIINQRLTKDVKRKENQVNKWKEEVDHRKMVIKNLQRKLGIID